MTALSIDSKKKQVKKGKWRGIRQRAFNFFCSPSLSCSIALFPFFSVLFLVVYFSFLRILRLSYHFSFSSSFSFPIILLLFPLRAPLDDNINRHKQHAVSYCFDSTSFHWLSPVSFFPISSTLLFFRLFSFFFSSIAFSYFCVYVVGPSFSYYAVFLLHYVQRCRNRTSDFCFICNDIKVRRVGWNATRKLEDLWGAR